MTALPHTAGHGLNRRRTLKALPDICREIQAVAMNIGAAATKHGIPGSTFKRYNAKGKAVLKRLLDWAEAEEAWEEAPKDNKPGERPEKPKLNANEKFYAEVSWAIEQARSTCLSARLARIAKGDTGWQGAAWLVERNPMWRQDYAPPARMELSGPGGGPIQTDVTVSAVEHLDRLLSKREQGGSDGEHEAGDNEQGGAGVNG